MAANSNGHWHAAHGGGLPFRAPRVDEAIPYSPFTSIVPFSPDIIPFPAAAPPTPPSTLTPEQQSAASSTIRTLNDEIERPASTSQRLEKTLQDLRELLNPDTLLEFAFKPVTQLTRPREASSSSQSNDSEPSVTPRLSPFASQLLASTRVAWTAGNDEGQERQTQSRAHPAHQTPRTAPRPVSHPHITPQSHPQAAYLNHSAHSGHSGHSGHSAPSVQVQVRVSNLHQPSPSPAVVRTPLRPGPAVVVKSLAPGARPDDYRRFDEPEMPSAKRKERPENSTTVMRSREKEIADRNIQELYSALSEIGESRESVTTVETDEGDLPVLRGSALSSLADRVSKVVNLGCFATVPAKQVLRLQSLCDPLITATLHMTLYVESCDGDDLASRLIKAHNGLKACRLVLQTMTEGCDDRRICSEDRIQSIIKLLKRVFDSCITPVVEARRSDPLFALASQYKQDFYPVVRLSGTILGQMATLIGKVKLSAMTLSPVEATAIDIIFAQNSEKENDSVLGIQKFESFRQRALDVLAQIFAHHVDQRDSIRNDVLTNLERLPDKRASARHFKSAHESPIMLVSALFMRLVQAAASNNGDNNSDSSNGVADSKEEEEHSSDSDSETTAQKSRRRKKTTGQTPQAIAASLSTGARTVALVISSTLVARAENVSKSGDKPFRNLLDLFIEDLCNVLGSPEWPAASTFLESLLGSMLPFVQNYKEKGVQNADMALSAMGSMGCGIIEFNNRLRKIKRSLDISQSDLASKLVPLADDALKKSINPKDMLSINGPYRVVLESLDDYLNPQSSHANRDDDPHLRSLRGYYATAWASAFHKTFGDICADDAQQPYLVELEKHVDNIVMNPKWFSKEYNFQAVTDNESRLAAGIIASQETFCLWMQSLVNHLLSYTRSQSAKVKSRAMTSLTQMIEKDPQILDEKTFPRLALLMADASPMVRENTVSLVAKCLEQDPSLEKYCLPGILKLMGDPANGPKKKAIKLLKDIYVSSSEQEKKARIATELLLPVLDDDKTIAELARATFEDIWVAPLRISARIDINQLKLNRETRVSLIILAVQGIQGRLTYIEAFESLFKTLLSVTAKNGAENFEVCKEIVNDMVSRVIGTADTEIQARTLQSLSIFAKVNPKLFTTSQLDSLKLYLNDFKSAQDIANFRPTVVIFRYVFPALSGLQESFLDQVRTSLASVTGMLASQAAQGSHAFKQTLVDVAHCSWTISQVRGFTSGLNKLISMVCSIAVQLEPLSYSARNDAKLQSTKILPFMILLGVFGKVCDFDQHIGLFNANFRRLLQSPSNAQRAAAGHLPKVLAWRGPSVAVLFLDLILPFTRQTWDIRLREQALCSIGEICQKNTKHFTRADIEKAFKLPFVNRDQRLTRVVLTQFRDFLEAAERRSETGAEISVGEGTVKGAQRLETSFKASDNDYATTLLARQFLSEISQTALSNSTDLALPATEILVSVSKQGLLHPKESGAALVALTTSQNPQIAAKAAAEHRKIHLQHESMFEKEYVSAVKQAFDYQRDVFADPRGAIEPSYKPKMQLLFEAFKQGSTKTLKKFLTNLLNQLDFDLSKFEVKEPVPEPVLFTRFCLENCAFFDFAKVDQVIHAILTIEGIVLKQTGPSVALAIETELAEQHFAEQQQPSVDGGPVAPMQDIVNGPTISTQRLHQLTAAAIILHLMWETRIFLRKAYNLQGKITAKDMTRPAIRNNLVPGKDLWQRFTSLVATLESDADSMRKECMDFAEIINVDREHAVGEEDEDAHDQLARAAAGYETPDEGEHGESPVATSGRGRKRKSSASNSGTTPKKPRGRPAGSKKQRRMSYTPDDSD